MKIEKEFIPYEQSLALKELGFDEQCLALYDLDGKITIEFVNWKNAKNRKSNYLIATPLYQQAFRWLMIKCEQICEKEISLKFWLDGSGSCKLMNLDDELFDYDSEIECLKKLIEIVKK